MVLRGSKPLYKAMFEAFRHQAPEGGWSSKDQYVFSEEQMRWYEAQGCRWHKVEAGPGDLILWDSVSQTNRHLVQIVSSHEPSVTSQRTCHYGTPPRSENFRIATCKRSRSGTAAMHLCKDVDI